MHVFFLLSSSICYGLYCKEVGDAKGLMMIDQHDTSRQKTNDFNDESKLVKQLLSSEAGVTESCIIFFILRREFSIDSGMVLKTIKTAHTMRVSLYKLALLLLDTDSSESTWITLLSGYDVTVEQQFIRGDYSFR